MAQYPKDQSKNRRVRRERSTSSASYYAQNINYISNYTNNIFAVVLTAAPLPDPSGLLSWTRPSPCRSSGCGAGTAPAPAGCAPPAPRPPVPSGAATTHKQTCASNGPRGGTRGHWGHWFRRACGLRPTPRHQRPRARAAHQSSEIGLNGHGQAKMVAFLIHASFFEAQPAPRAVSFPHRSRELTKEERNISIARGYC